MSVYSDGRYDALIYYINISSGFFISGIGTIGNVLNIIMFAGLKQYRGLPSSLFLAGTSLGEQLAIIGLVFPQTIGYVIGYDPRSVSSSFCKISSILYTGGGMCALICFYLAGIDRYLQTSRSATKRQWMTSRKAILLLCISLFVSLLMGLPFGLFRDIIPSLGQCDYNNALFSQFAFIFYGIAGIVLPLTLLTVFGYLTWRNIRQTQLRQAMGQNTSNIARQVTRMILSGVTSTFISVIPSASFQIYTLLFGKDLSTYTDAELLTLCITQVLIYADCCVTFYLYLLISPTFLKNVKEMLWLKSRRINVASINTSSRLINTHQRTV